MTGFTFDALAAAVDRAPRVRWSAVGVVALALLVAAVVPGGAGAPTTGPLGAVGLDKWLHAAGYLALAATLTWALDRRVDDGPDLAVAGPGLAVVVAVGYGVALEVVQAPLATRSASTGDALADAAGAIVGAAVAVAVLALARRQRACASDRSTSEK